MQPIPEDWASAVAVVAHPDDLEYGVAAAVARWTGQGKKVAYLLATRGEAGIAGMDPAQVGPLRVEEEQRSAAVVGVTQVEFLDHADGLVEYGVPLRRDLAAAFRRLRPEVVITMSFDLTWGEDGPVNHADHRAVGLAVLDACRDADNEWVFPEAGEAWHGIRDAYVAAAGEPDPLRRRHRHHRRGRGLAARAPRLHRGPRRRLRRRRVPAEDGGLRRPGRRHRVRRGLPPLPDGLGRYRNSANRARSRSKAGLGV